MTGIDRIIVSSDDKVTAGEENFTVEVSRYIYDTGDFTERCDYMKVVAAIDSFKGSMTSMEAGNAVKKGILAAKPDAEVWLSPLADGGEGTVDALIEGLGAEKYRLPWQDRLEKKCRVITVFRRDKKRLSWKWHLPQESRL